MSRKIFENYEPERKHMEPGIASKRTSLAVIVLSQAILVMVFI